MCSRIGTIRHKGQFAIKAPALPNFIAKLLDVSILEEEPEHEIRKLFMDISSRDSGVGACIILTSLKGYKLNCALRFTFKATIM